MAKSQNLKTQRSIKRMLAIFSLPKILEKVATLFEDSTLGQKITGVEVQELFNAIITSLIDEKQKNFSLKTGSIQPHEEEEKCVSAIKDIISSELYNNKEQVIKLPNPIESYDNLENFAEICSVFAGDKNKTMLMLAAHVATACRYPEGISSLNPAKKLHLMADVANSVLNREREKLPENFSALLPVSGISDKIQKRIWKKTFQTAGIYKLFGDENPSDIGNNIKYWHQTYLPNIVQSVKLFLLEFTNGVAFEEILPTLDSEQLARKLVIQHVGDPDAANKQFLLKALLDVTLEKTAKVELKKQLVDIGLSANGALDQVVAHFVANYSFNLEILQRSAENTTSGQLNVIRTQIGYSVTAVHGELQKEAAVSQHEQQYKVLCRTTNEALDNLIQQALPKYFEKDNKLVQWDKVKLSHIDRNQLLFFASENKNSDTRHDGLLNLIVNILRASSDFNNIIEGRNPVVQKDTTGKDITYLRATDAQKNLFIIDNLKAIDVHSLTATLENCANLPETFEDYSHQQEMLTLAQNIEKRFSAR